MGLFEVQFDVPFQMQLGVSGGRPPSARRSAGRVNPITVRFFRDADHAALFPQVDVDIFPSLLQGEEILPSVSGSAVHTTPLAPRPGSTSKSKPDSRPKQYGDKDILPCRFCLPEAVFTLTLFQAANSAYRRCCATPQKEKVGQGFEIIV